MTDYKEADVPAQGGKTVLITGANTGIGYDTARVLALRGARVLLGCRSEDKAVQAIDKIKAIKSDAEVCWVPLDLASLASIEAAADIVNQENRLDALVNNAGVMMPPKLETNDGFELQFGVNHLAHRNGKIDYGDINAEKSYSRMARYGMSKFANILFTYELQRKLEAASLPAISVACHPGGSATELGRHIPPLIALFLTPLNFFMNTSAEGALPTLMATTRDDVEGGDYFGPMQMGEMRHSAHKVDTVTASKDEADAARLWALSTKLTGVEYVF